MNYKLKKIPAIIIILTLISFLFYTCTKGKTNKTILVIGDSNGAFEGGWVDQLSGLRPNDSIVNFSISGNTIGFFNLSKDTLNTLYNIKNYLVRAHNEYSRYDNILLMLGTNDCKAVFDSMQDKVAKNLDSLVSIIAEYDFRYKPSPDIYLITPPPIADDSLLIPKYYGAAGRLKKLIPDYRTIALKYNVHYIDIYSPMKPRYNSVTLDGIHLNETGYKQMASIINEAMNDTD